MRRCASWASGCPVSRSAPLARRTSAVDVGRGDAKSSSASIVAAADRGILRQKRAGTHGRPMPGASDLAVVDRLRAKLERLSSTSTGEDLQPHSALSAQRRLSPQVDASIDSSLPDAGDNATCSDESIDLLAPVEAALQDLRRVMASLPPANHGPPGALSKNIFTSALAREQEELRRVRQLPDDARSVAVALDSGCVEGGLLPGSRPLATAEAGLDGAMHRLRCSFGPSASSSSAIGGAASSQPDALPDKTSPQQHDSPAWFEAHGDNGHGASSAASRGPAASVSEPCTGATRLVADPPTVEQLRWVSCAPNVADVDADCLSGSGSSSFGRSLATSLSAYALPAAPSGAEVRATMGVMQARGDLEALVQAASRAASVCPACAGLATSLQAAAENELKTLCDLDRIEHVDVRRLEDLAASAAQGLEVLQAALAKSAWHVAVSPGTMSDSVGDSVGVPHQQQCTDIPDAAASLGLWQGGSSGPRGQPYQQPADTKISTLMRSAIEVETAVEQKLRHSVPDVRCGSAQSSGSARRKNAGSSSMGLKEGGGPLPQGSSTTTCISSNCPSARDTVHRIGGGPLPPATAAPEEMSCGTPARDSGNGRCAAPGTPTVRSPAALTRRGFSPPQRKMPSLPGAAPEQSFAAQSSFAASPLQSRTEPYSPEVAAARSSPSSAGTNKSRHAEMFSSVAASMQRTLSDIRASKRAQALGKSPSLADVSERWSPPRLGGSAISSPAGRRCASSAARLGPNPAPWSSPTATRVAVSPVPRSSEKSTRGGPGIAALTALLKEAEDAVAAIGGA